MQRARRNSARKRHARRGSIMLPFEGMIWLMILGLPAFCFLSALKEHQRATGVLQEAAQTSFFHVFMVLLISAVLAFVSLFFLIGLPIFMGVFEAGSEKIGLGASQYWMGKTLREKVNRELFRFGLFGSSGAVAFLLSHCWFGSMPLNVELFGGLSFWGPLLILFYCPLALIKTQNPAFGGFRGDPDARYHHVF